MLGIYARTSVKKDEETPLQTQIDEGIKFAETNGFQYRVYKDEGKSGYKIEDDQNPFENRPDFERLLKDISGGEITDVWVWENSRLSRNSFASGMIYRIFEKRRITLWEHGRKYDLTNPTDKLLKTILDGFAEYERMMIVLRTSRGRKISIDMGKRHGRLIGYDHNSTTHETKPNKEKLAEVRQIFDWYLDGWNLQKIASKTFVNLERRVHRIKNTQNVLKHEEYTGEILKNNGLEIERKFRNGEITSLQELLKDDYWNESKWFNEKIITREEWIEANERLEFERQRHSKARKDGKQRRETNKSLSSGIMTCAFCNSPYYVNYDSKKPQYFDYLHLTTFREHKCENRTSISGNVIDTIMDVYFFCYYIMFDDTITKIETQKNEIKEEKQSVKIEIDTLQAERKKKLTLIDRLESSILSGNLENINSALKMIDKVSAELHDLEIELQTVSNKMTELNEKNSELDEERKFYKGTIETLRDYFTFRKNGDYAECRKMLEKVIGGVKVYGDIVRFENPVAYEYFYFNVKHNYNVIYPFIEKALDIQIKENYSAGVEAWKNARIDIYNNFKEEIEKFLESRLEKENLIVHNELSYNNNFKIITDIFGNESGLRINELNYNDLPNKDIKLENGQNINLKKFFADDDLDEDFETGFHLYTATPEECFGEKQYLNSEVAKMVNKTLESVRWYAEKKGIKREFLGSGEPKYLWSEKDIDEYKQHFKIK